MKTSQLTGTLGFALIWGGQVISMMGSNMTRFALMIWVWQETNSAIAMTLIGVSAGIPTLLANFIAGPLVDRWDRKRLMMVGDVTAGITTVALFLLYSTNNLAVWHLYVATAIASVAGSFQHLAYSTSITMLLPKEHYARASGLNSLAEYGSKIAAPLLAGLLISPIGLNGIMLLDIATFVVAVGALLLVHVPNPKPHASDTERKEPFLKQTSYGFRYIFARPSLRGFVVITFAFSLAESLGYPLIAPMILARTGGDEAILGTVQAFLGIGGVIGALLVSIWGGPKRRIHAVLIGLTLTGLFGDALMGIGQTLVVWIVAALFLEIFIPMTIGAHVSIWQSKVAPHEQGRVFAARSLMNSISEPVSMLLAGLAADKILEPALMPDGALAPTLGVILGTGAGAGMGLIILICGIMSALAGLSGYLNPYVRNVEDILPDHTQKPVEEVVAPVG
jgi:DHA3 family macrolide efflux protein-like MFS transporter